MYKGCYMAENGNGKSKATTVVSIVTSILMVLAVGGSFVYTVSIQNSEYKQQRSSEISKLNSKIRILETKVKTCEQKDKALARQMSDLRSSNQELQRKLGIITEILNRLDERTKKLENYIYSKDKEK